MLNVPRIANEQDIPALVRLINIAYRVEEFFLIGGRTNTDDLTGRLRKPHAGFYVIPDDRDDAELTGAVYFELKGTHGYFGLLAVSPALQGRGLARMLVGAVEHHCRASGCDALDMDVVNLRTELPAFYHKLGFTAYGTAPFREQDRLKRPAHLVLMSKKI